MNYVINSLATDKEQFTHSSEEDVHGECAIFVKGLLNFPSLKYSNECSTFPDVP